jgi:hypothetical protein
MSKCSCKGSGKVYSVSAMLTPSVAYVDDGTGEQHENDRPSVYATQCSLCSESRPLESLD